MHPLKLIALTAILATPLSAQTSGGITIGDGISIGGKNGGINLGGAITVDPNGGVKVGNIEVGSDSGLNMPGVQVEENGSISLGSDFDTDAMAEALETSGAAVNVMILFEFGSAALTEKGREQVEQVADAFFGLDDDATIIIEGHTDNVGSDADNLVLSIERAQTVLTALKTDHDVDQNLVQTGKGEAQPIADNTTDHGRSLNRRVTFIRQ